MSAESINVSPYYGALLATDFLAGSVNLILPYVGESESGSLEDADGWLSGDDDGVSTFNGEAITYIGSGVATPGAETLGLFVATGPAVDIVVFEAGGQIYFHYPAGEPNLTGALLLNVDIDASPYQVFTPVCFAAGTMIRTPTGETAIESLTEGDLVTDIDGQSHKIRWIGRRRLHLPKSGHFDKWRPVRIAAHAFGRDCPVRSTWVSQEHRILVESWRSSLFLHCETVLVAAKFLMNETAVTLDRSLDEVEYFHLLCDTHVVLLANGMPSESLLLGPSAAVNLTEQAREEIAVLFPELAGDIGAMSAARPVVTGMEAVVLGLNRCACPQPEKRQAIRIERLREG